MTADAVVVSARQDGQVDLEFAQNRQCAACAGTCLWKRIQAARLERLQVADRLEPGTQVTVELPGRQVLLASILLYGAPLFAILAGAVAGSLIAGSDIGTLIGSVLALGLVVGSFRALRSRLEQLTLASLVVTAKP